MSYYHVRLDYLDKKLRANQTLYEYDLTDIDTIKKRIINPYINNAPFFFRGAKIDGSDVRIINVFSSEYSISECIQYAYRRLPSNVFLTYSNEDMLPFNGLVYDITSEVITGENVTDCRLETHSETIDSSSNKKVFIVHGHDSEARLEVETLMHNLKLTPIVLFKEDDEGNTIIEKIEKNSDVRYAIVLYTYCDDGKDKTEDHFCPRARQNVVFEHGYFVSKLGRKNVCALVKGKIELPGDYSGVIYKTMDDAGAWKLSLAKEMKKAGLDIDLNNLM